MTPSNRSITRPPSRLAKMLMVLLLLGIVFAFWIEAPRDPSSQNGQAVALAEQEPVAAMLDHGVLRVVDAVSGKVLFRHSLSIGPKSDQVKRMKEWYRWPGTWVDSQREPAEITSGSMEFLCEDQILVLHSYRSDGKQEWTLAHLPTGKIKSWVDDIPDQTRVVMIDDLAVGLRRQFSKAMGASAPEVSWALNPMTHATSISEEQKQRAIAGPALHLTKRGYVAKPDVTLRTSEFHNETEEVITFPKHTEVDQVWSLGDGKSICSFETDSFVDSTAKSNYWLVDETHQEAKAIDWPFKPGSVMTEYHIEDDSPFIIANVSSAIARQIGAKENFVAWDLVSGRVTPLPQRVFDAKRFGKRILATAPQGVSWFDLDSGRERSVVRFGAEQPPSKYYIVAAWLIAWVWLVRPTNEGDFTRRFGAAFMILIVGALSISRLKSANFYLEWPVMEWAMCGAFFLPLMGMLIAASIQRSVSWFMLGSGWAITLLLLAGLIFAGESQSYDATLFRPTTPTSTPMTPVRNAAWLYINHPGEFITAPADPISTTGGWFGPTSEYRVEFLSESVSERQP